MIRITRRVAGAGIAAAVVAAALAFGHAGARACDEHAQGRHEGGHDELFYPPEMVQKLGRQAGLSDEQMDRLRKEVLATRRLMVTAEAKVKALHIEIEMGVLDDATPIEEILKRVEQLGAAETEMKKLHVGLLLRIRRSLTPEQRRRLDEMRPMFHHGGPPPGAAHPPHGQPGGPGGPHGPGGPGGPGPGDPGGEHHPPPPGEEPRVR